MRGDIYSLRENPIISEDCPGRGGGYCPCWVWYFSWPQLLCCSVPSSLPNHLWEEALLILPVHFLLLLNVPGPSLVAEMVKNLPAMQMIQDQSLGQEDPQRGKWQPTPVFLPRKSHGRQSLAGLVGYSQWGCIELDTTEQLTLSFSFTFSFSKCVKSLHLISFSCRQTTCFWRAAKTFHKPNKTRKIKPKNGLISLKPFVQLVSEKHCVLYRPNYLVLKNSDNYFNIEINGKSFK